MTNPRDQRNTRIRGLHDAGWTYDRIAADVGVSRTTVQRVLGRKKERPTQYGAKHGKFIETPLDESKCGTKAGARAHQRRGQELCHACKQAETRYDQYERPPR